MVEFMSNNADNVINTEKRGGTQNKLITQVHSATSNVEEVFDKPRGCIFCILTWCSLRGNGVVSSGKEAKVYWGKTKDGTDLAVKINLTSSAEFKKGILKYIEGDPRFKNIKKDTRSLFSVWAAKEFRNLQEAYDAKVPVPHPIAVKSNGGYGVHRQKAALVHHP
jgi:serine/threonine-protein kinase RIO1